MRHYFPQLHLLRVKSQALMFKKFRGRTADRVQIFLWWSAPFYLLQEADLRLKYEAAGKAEVKTAEQSRDRVLQARVLTKAYQSFNFTNILTNVNALSVIFFDPNDQFNHL